MVLSAEQTEMYVYIVATTNQDSCSHTAPITGKRLKLTLKLPGMKITCIDSQ